jgi:LmbE family N-acetylglucosaminyl deacetylase
MGAVERATASAAGERGGGGSCPRRGGLVFIAATQALQSLSSVLCLGAHADDIEIGCAGTLLKLRQLNPQIELTFVVLSGNDRRVDEARESVEALTDGGGNIDLVVKSFRESYFPYDGAAIKDFFNELGERLRPDLVFTHYRDDRHQDHRVVSDLTWNTFRDHLILEYEIPKYDGDIGVPNVFVHLDRCTCERKVDHLQRRFVSQAEKPWFSSDTFLSMLRLRGIEGKSPDGYAEAFYARKLILA